MQQAERVKIEYGKGVELQYRDELNDFIIAIIRSEPGPNGDVSLYLTLTELKAFLNVCKYVFVDRLLKEGEVVPESFWEDSNFHFMSPLLDKPDLFWFSVGPLSFHMPTEQVKGFYMDLQSILDRIGGVERFKSKLLQ